MASDKARITYDETRMYRSVVVQQGRVTLEADANEAEEIRSSDTRATLVDVIGPHGSPDDGFKVTVPASGSNKPLDFSFAAGTIYVGGMRVVNPPRKREDGTDIDPTFWGQRDDEWIDYPENEYPDNTDAFIEAVYLRLTEHEVSAVEDPALQEVALGGPDSTTRIRATTHVERMEVNDNTCKRGFGAVVSRLADTGLFLDSDTMQLRSATELRVAYEDEPEDQDECQPIRRGGFLGPDNQLIRVQVTSDNHFLWAYDNASTLYRATVIDGTQLTLENIPVDVYHQPQPPKWVQVLATTVKLDDTARIAAHTGQVRQVKNYDPTARIVELESALGISDDKEVFLRVWHNRQPLPANEATAVELTGPDGGTGVYIHCRYKPVEGDYWMIGVRPSVPQKVFPERLNTWQRADGPRRWIAPLAVISWHDDLETADVTDCRPLFDPLTVKCCVRVHPGSDIRGAIARVKEAGGGCVELCPGLHRVVGPLELDGAVNLRLVGKGMSTLLRLEPDADGQGGLVIRDSERIAVENMFIVGIEIDHVIWVGHGDDPHVTRELTLRGLTILGFAEAPHGGLMGRPTTGVRLARCAGVVIDDCRVFATMAVCSVWGSALPSRQSADDPLGDYGTGVSDLVMTDCQLGFSGIGILSARSEGWRVERCDILSMVWPETVGEVLTKSPTVSTHAAVLDLFLGAFDGGPPEKATIAVAGHLWDRCLLRDCALRGHYGVYSSWWMRSAIEDCRITATVRGFGAWWAHRSNSSNNDITAVDGPAVAVLGAYHATIQGSRLRGAFGFLKLTLRDVALELPILHRLLLEGGYGLATGDGGDETLAYILITETAALLGVEELIAKIDAAIAAVTEFPPLLLYLARELDAQSKSVEWTRLGPLIPLVALSVADNTVESDGDAVLMEQFTTVGGLSISGNRLSSRHAQGVRVNAWPPSAPASFITLSAQRALDMITGEIPAVLTTDLSGAMPAETPQELLDALPLIQEATVEALEKLAEWKRKAEPQLVSDYRINGNTIRCAQTAIESNLYDLDITANDITLHNVHSSKALLGALPTGESAPNLDELIASGDVLAVHDALFGGLLTKSELEDSLALDDPQQLSRAFIRYRAPRGGDNSRYTYINFETLKADAEQDAEDYEQAVTAGNEESARAALERIYQKLEAVMSTYGIWVKGQGVRVADNHVSVLLSTAGNADNDSSALRGGVLVHSDELTIFAGLLLQLVSGEIPMLSAVPQLLALLVRPKTMIDHNEIVAGTGDGVLVRDLPPVAISETSSAMDVPFGFANLSVRTNHIRAMAGAGVLVEPEALAVELSVEANRIVDCATFGVEVIGAGLCRLTGNHVQRCGYLNNGAGIAADWIVGLDLQDNRLLENGETLDSAGNILYAGGVRLRNVFGPVRALGNELTLNNNGGLYWRNGESDLGATIPPGFAWLALMRRTGSLIATVANNAFNSADYLQDRQSFPCFVIENLEGALSVAANICTAAEGAELVAALASIESVVVTGNHFHGSGGTPLSIDNIERGVISSNVNAHVGDPEMEIEVTNGSGLVHQLNVPEISLPNPIP